MLTRVVGPHRDLKGKYWIIDGRDEEIPTGSIYRVQLHWGARVRVSWELERSIMASSGMMPSATCSLFLLNPFNSF